MHGSTKLELQCYSLQCFCFALTHTHTPRFTQQLRFRSSDAYRNFRISQLNVFIRSDTCVYWGVSSWNPNFNHWNLVGQSISASPPVLLPSSILPSPSSDCAFNRTWKMSSFCSKMLLYLHYFSWNSKILNLRNWKVRKVGDCYNRCVVYIPLDGGLVVSMLASGTRVRWFKPGRSRWIFRASEKFSACLPSEGKWKNLSHVPALRHVKEPSISVTYDVLVKFLV
jgi:hypothetical protein